jgi:hypothetical protein
MGKPAHVNGPLCPVLKDHVQLGRIVGRQAAFPLGACAIDGKAQVRADAGNLADVLSRQVDRVRAEVAERAERTRGRAASDTP